MQQPDLESIEQQWRRERPDLDPLCMIVCGAVWRAGRRLMAGLQDNLDRFGLDFAGLDVLLTLRRQGAGQSMSPGAMAADMMLSSGAMTARLDRLESRGLLRRAPDPADRRGVRISLTEEGFELADRLVAAHVAVEQAMLSDLSRDEQTKLLKALSRLAPEDATQS